MPSGCIPNHGRHDDVRQRRPQITRTDQEITRRRQLVASGWCADTATRIVLPFTHRGVCVMVTPTGDMTELERVRLVMKHGEVIHK
jgi:hypothetical protein